MDTQEAQLVGVERMKKPSTWQRLKDAVFVGAIGASAMTVSVVHAADDAVDYSQATGQMSGVKTAVVALVGTCLTIIGIVLAYSYFRRSAK